MSDKMVGSILKTLLCVSEKTNKNKIIVHREN